MRDIHDYEERKMQLKDVTSSEHSLVHYFYVSKLDRKKQYKNDDVIGWILDDRIMFKI